MEKEKEVRKEGWKEGMNVLNTRKIIYEANFLSKRYKRLRRYRVKTHTTYMNSVCLMLYVYLLVPHNVSLSLSHTHTVSFSLSLFLFPSLSFSSPFAPSLSFTCPRSHGWQEVPAGCLLHKATPPLISLIYLAGGWLGGGGGASYRGRAGWGGKDNKCGLWICCEGL